MKPFLFCISIVLAGKTAMCQDLKFGGAAAAFGYSKSLNSKADLTFSLALKSRLQPRTIEQTYYGPQLTEYYLQGLYSFKFSRNWQMGLGYGFQRNNPFNDDWRNEHRLVQQIQFNTKFGKTTWYNRLRAEERWFHFPVMNAVSAVRFRWQSGWIIPLSKGYLHANNEIYLIPSRYRNAVYSENWLYAGYAWKSRSNRHFESGAGINSVVRNKAGERLVLFLLQFNYNIMQGAKVMEKTPPMMNNRHF
ncbi:MAG TPA: DUF2490 domain-containing protein [Flavisolibacter sp.]|nr:DUF2490 domain-containing protein [Flavisolibacter sp.]